MVLLTQHSAKCAEIKRQKVYIVFLRIWDLCRQKGLLQNVAAKSGGHLKTGLDLCENTGIHILRINTSSQKQPFRQKAGLFVRIHQQQSFMLNLSAP